MPSQTSPLARARGAYQPKLPSALQEFGCAAAFAEGDPTGSIADQAQIRSHFPNTYGLPVLTFDGAGERPTKATNTAVILSGGQAPGGHNVIAGLYDGLTGLHAGNRLYGFLGGPEGLIENQYVILDDKTIDSYRNTGGFDMIGSGRTKIQTEDQFKTVAENCKALGITAVVVIGGDDSNTNACVLAEYMAANNTGINVIGCPKTIDGDLKNEWIEASFGFDTATKVYADLIGNIARDSASAKKYWHFIKLMGRSASHIALECALKTHPNVTIISEEVEEKNLTLRAIVDQIASVVRDRAAISKNYGVVLAPEGLIEFVPEVKLLIGELNDILADNSAGDPAAIGSQLSAASSAVFDSLPAAVQRQLLMDRDPHGNVRVSHIETDKMLIEMVDKRLKEWALMGEFDGAFRALNHFFGYEGRCAAPSNFDTDYCYSLGFTAAALIAADKTGYIASVRNLDRPAGEWAAGGVPLTMMMNLERRHGETVPVIQKALVQLDNAAFAHFEASRDAWAINDDYVYPGPIQYFGPSELCDQHTITMDLERS